MLSIAQAAARRGSAGEPLKGMYRPLEARSVQVCRGQLTLVVGPPSAGKSLLAFNLVVRMQVPTLAFLLDSDQLTAAARFASILTGDRFLRVRDDIDAYAGRLSELRDFQTCFFAQDMDDIRLQVQAYEQRYGLPPDLIVVDNLGNLTSAMDNEWALLKALTLELDLLARENQCAVIAAAHTTDLESADPAGRTKILGKISQYPRLILSVGFNPMTGEYRVAHVKNSAGPSDVSASNPVLMYADPARMLISEDNPAWSPSSALAPNYNNTVDTGWASMGSYSQRNLGGEC